jgi:putative transposase
LCSRTALVAENLFLRRQLALFLERETKPGPTTPAARVIMIALGKVFFWCGALVVVKPETFVKWHRAAFRTIWMWKSRKRGRPALPQNIRQPIREIAADNPIWGEADRR